MTHTFLSYNVMQSCMKVLPSLAAIIHSRIKQPSKLDHSYHDDVSGYMLCKRRCGCQEKG